MAQKWHPDRFDGDEKEMAEKKFVDIAAAKEVLTNDGEILFMFIINSLLHFKLYFIQIFIKTSGIVRIYLKKIFLRIKINENQRCNFFNYLITVLLFVECS